MKKRNLFTLVAAISMLGSTGVATLSTNQPVVQAAKKTSSKYARVQIKYGAKAYGFKNGKVYALKNKKKSVYLRSINADAVMSYKYKNVTYYYVKFGKASLFVRAKDVKKLNKKSVPSIQSLYKKEEEAKLAAAQKEINALTRPATAAAKISQETSYWNSDGKVATDKLAVGTELTIMAKDDVTAGSNTVSIYYAKTKDNKVIVIPQDAVTLDDPNAQVLQESAYESASKQYSSDIAAIIKKYGLVVKQN